MIHIPDGYLYPLVYHASVFLKQQVYSAGNTDLAGYLNRTFNNLRVPPSKTISYMFNKGEAARPGVKYTQNMPDSKLIHTYGKPTKNQVTIVAGLASKKLVGSNQETHRVAGEYIEATNTVVIYLLSVPGWNIVQNTIALKTLNNRQATNMLGNVKMAGSHELTHVVQALYPNSVVNISRTTGANINQLTDSERYMLNTDEFMPLLDSLVFMCVKQFALIKDKLPDLKPATVKQAHKDFIDTVTGTTPNAKTTVVKKTTKASDFFLTLKKYDTVRWKKAVSELTKAVKV
jgi:hypothetical protein